MKKLSRFVSALALVAACSHIPDREQAERRASIERIINYYRHATFEPPITPSTFCTYSSPPREVSPLPEIISFPLYSQTNDVCIQATDPNMVNCLEIAKAIANNRQITHGGSFAICLQTNLDANRLWYKIGMERHLAQRGRMQTMIFPDSRSVMLDLYTHTYICDPRHLVATIGVDYTVDQRVAIDGNENYVFPTIPTQHTFGTTVVLAPCRRHYYPGEETQANP